LRISSTTTQKLAIKPLLKVTLDKFNKVIIFKSREEDITMLIKLLSENKILLLTIFQMVNKKL
jgi:hypothetical protein